MSKETCAECEGTGWTTELQGTWFKPEMLPAPCSKCCGSVKQNKPAPKNAGRLHTDKDSGNNS